MTDFSFDDGGALTQLAADLRAAGALVQARAAKLVRHHGILLQTQVKANASGRPGPRAPTGDYRRSIDLRVGVDNGAVVAQIGTNRPQGRRLEFGFHGVDSRGRHYDQPPYAHFGPALDKIGPKFEADLADLAGDLGRKGDT